jgi:antitoxin YefM
VGHGSEARRQGRDESVGPDLPTVADQPAVVAAATATGRTPAQIRLVTRLAANLAAGVMAMSASEARKRLFPLIEQVNDDQEPVEILSKAGTAYLVSADRWHSIVETAHLLRSPANAEHLLRSIAEAEAGHTEVQELIDPRPDVA